MIVLISLREMSLTPTEPVRQQVELVIVVISLREMSLPSIVHNRSDKTNVKNDWLAETNLASCRAR